MDLRPAGPSSDNCCCSSLRRSAPRQNETSMCSPRTFSVRTADWFSRTPPCSPAPAAEPERPSAARLDLRLSDLSSSPGTRVCGYPGT